MKTIRTPHVVAIIVLAGMLQAGATTYAAERMAPPAKGTPDPLSDEALKAASDRIRQTGHNLQEDIQQALRKARAQRAALEARQDAERKQEAERSRQQAARDAAALAAAKEARQRQALEATQAQARKKAEESAARAEHERQAAAKAQREMEEKLAREQQAAKAAADKPKLGGETKFGVDI
jgi:hypothetical protein